jgi:hypothetical protein
MTEPKRAQIRPGLLTLSMTSSSGQSLTKMLPQLTQPVLRNLGDR